MISNLERSSSLVTSSSFHLVDLSISSIGVDFKIKQLTTGGEGLKITIWDTETCILFNYVDDRYFISGSIDAKVCIWSIPDRQVVDWNNRKEMVTAACYTPHGCTSWFIQGELWFVQHNRSHSHPCCF